MKFFLLSVFSTLVITSINAQVELNIFAGPQATTAYYKVKGAKQDTKFKYGFQAGAGLKVTFEDKLFFAPAVFYSLKGYKVTFTRFAFPPGPEAADNNTSLHTVELAALLQYDFSRKPGHFYIKAGPSLDFQLKGKEKFNLITTGSVERDMPFSYGDYGHYSANLVTQLGYETSGGLVVFLQYSHGLGSINNADGGPSIQHRVYGLSIGKFLNRKKDNKK